MLQTLYKYLILHKKATIAGIGTFSVHRTPASLDFANKAFIAPVNRFEFDNDEAAEDKNLYSFISKEHTIEEREAMDTFGAFSRNLKENLQTQGAVELPRLGSLTRDVAGKITFRPVDPIASFYPNVPIETTSNEVLKKEPVAVEVEEEEVHAEAEIETEEVKSNLTKKEYWWIFAVVLAIAAIAAIVYYYNENGSLR
ncbi:hypothetical protein [Segetibacter aerophilus]|uniref:CCDC81-like prokaryotic HU domain-containing protein n=1 Tax=Segetibacter aerophilus TaxID=670293 RepID=A0A512B7K1_9BACT|nr:hypothetical protein [Segetibacter aerophilus]GEO07941.1 hypothetical protein SAE01_04370 [Segetibacter aerophilus]